MKTLYAIGILVIFIFVSLPVTADYPVPMQATANGIIPSVINQPNNEAFSCPVIQIPQGSYPVGFRVDDWIDGSGKQTIGPGMSKIVDNNGVLVGTITYTDMYSLDNGDNGPWAFDWATTEGTYTGKVTVKAGNVDLLIYDYSGSNANSAGDAKLYAPQNGPGKWAKISHFDFCGYFTPKPTCSTAHISIVKFYDANANGINDDGKNIDGWKVSINGNDAFTPVDKETGFGKYTVKEYDPNQTSWMSTTSKSVDVNLATCGEQKKVEFGNLCIGPGGGLTLGFWSNPNGAKLVGSDDLAMLKALNLKNANGNDFDPSDYTSMRNWILKAQASNMAYMLSAQLTTMELNVFNGKVDKNAIIYAPGTKSANSLGFASITSIMAEADSALAVNGLTLAGSPNRNIQETLKNALDNANNNINFVQSVPCAFSFA